MTLDSFKRGLFGNPIFITQEGDKNVFTDMKPDFNLARALYTSVPAEKQQSAGVNFQLGNFCTPSFIDTFSWYIGIPTIASANQDYNTGANGWFKRNRSTLLRIIQQVLVDAKHYVWVRVEDISGQSRISIKQISRECVNLDECVRSPEGGFSKFVFTITETWKDTSGQHTSDIKWTLEPNKESYVINGVVPPGYEPTHDVTTKIKRVPVYEQVNRKTSYMADGIPEIAAAVPFIQRYDATMRKLGKHVDDGLVPRLVFKIKQMTKFITRSFGVSQEALDKGGVTVDASGMQNGFIDDKDDSISYLQKEDRSESAIKVLELLYFIIIELTMPEYLYGSAMNSTNASVREQSPVWEKKVDGKQGEFDEFFYWLADMFLEMSNAVSGLNKFGPVEEIEIKWPEVSAKDDVAMMNALSSLMTALDLALKNCIIGTETAFNAMKQFIPASGDFDSEQKKAKEFQRVMLELANIKERHAQGDIDTGDAINKLLGKKSVA